MHLVRWVLAVQLMVGVVTGFMSGSAQGQRAFPVWDEQVFTEVERRHGAQASRRIRNIYKFIRLNLNKPKTEQLELVNGYMNGLVWIADSELWKKEDYWATPFETLTTFGGDCEDIAIAKYTVLRLMGFADDELGFAYVLTAENEPHMVMVYKPGPEAEALVLDNQHPDVATAGDREDLLAVYAFRNNGDLVVIKDNGQGKRSILMTKEDQKLQKWLTVKDRAKENIASYLPFNNGQPLIPDWVGAKQVQ